MNNSDIVSLFDNKSNYITNIDKSNKNDLIIFIKKVLSILSELDVFIFGGFWRDYIYWQYHFSKNDTFYDNFKISDIDIFISNNTYKLFLKKLNKNLISFSVKKNNSYRFLNIKKYELHFKNNITIFDLLKTTINNQIVSNNTIQKIFSNNDFKLFLRYGQQELPQTMFFR